MFEFESFASEYPCEIGYSRFTPFRFMITGNDMVFDIQSSSDLTTSID